MKWMPKNAKPDMAGWYFVRNKPNERPRQVRYFDDSNNSWHLAKRSGFTPNDSFSEWQTWS